MAFQMENKRLKGQKHSKFIYHGFCSVEAKPSEVKSHLRPKVDLVTGGKSEVFTVGT